MATLPNGTTHVDVQLENTRYAQYRIAHVQVKEINGELIAFDGYERLGKVVSVWIDGKPVKL